MVGEAESFTNSIKDDIIDIGDKIKEEAPLEELKETAERLTPVLQETAENISESSAFEQAVETITELKFDLSSLTDGTSKGLKDF